jgi:hypothetical protein
MTERIWRLFEYFLHHTWPLAHDISTMLEARGHNGGRKSVVTADKLKRARELFAKGLIVREAAVRMKDVAIGRVQRVAGAHG